MTFEVIDAKDAPEHPIMRMWLDALEKVWDGDIPPERAALPDISVALMRRRGLR